jgi:asparagine synthase (glutamine-hydrolysing)
VCGLVGVVGFKSGHGVPAQIALTMAEAIRHRGPDDSGLWIDDRADIALAHRRLSIVDLSPAGHQPMLSASGRFVLVFNGEIYNCEELRATLAREGRAPAWRGHSDTEVLLEAAAAWGIRPALERATGMFALALFDRQERRLTLARDRLGEKPLYYGWIDDAFAFASELKSLQRHPAWAGEIDRDALALFMRHSNVPTPYSIYRRIRKLPPGSFLTFNVGTAKETLEVYWDAEERARRGSAIPFKGSAEDAVEQTQSLLRESIKRQMLADVPLGAFLSGGIDSSVVVALMQSVSERPVRTFSIGFNVEDYNEAPQAKYVARHIGTDHTELYLSEQAVLDVIPLLPKVYCEPFADSSQIPTYLVAKLARQHVTVSLSGDGGDELFSGYTRYGLAYGPLSLLGRVPAPLRRNAARAVTAVSPAKWDELFQRLPTTMAVSRAGDKLHKAATVVSAAPGDRLYEALISHWQEPDSILIGATEPQPRAFPSFGSDMRRMMFADLTGYLPDDILVKVDRAAMAVSLETRVPMLDHRLVELSFTLPDAILRRGGKSKWPLRQILKRYVPENVLTRPKMGFAIPLDRWLRGQLRPWAEDLLSEARLKRDGIFDPGPVRQAWKEHLSGTRNFQYKLWCVLMFQAWYQSQQSNASTSCPAVQARF